VEPGSLGPDPGSAGCCAIRNPQHAEGRPPAGLSVGPEQEPFGAELGDPLTDVTGHGRGRLSGLGPNRRDHLVEGALSVAEPPDPCAELVEQIEAAVVGADQDDPSLGCVRLDPG
jgi:hypothetical protein